MGYERGRQPEPDEEPELPESAGAAGQPAASGQLIGRTLGGRYRFDVLVGEGTFARVFRVYDLHRRVYLAAKVLRSDIANEPAFLERFRREAVVLSRLQHPHIVRYYDTVEVDGVVFILTDYIEGKTLQQVLREQKEPLAPFESLAYLTPLAAALHYAHHEGIVHRDLKPANILIDATGKLYVTDFGIARILSDSSTLTMDMSVGTPHYMSPEQILAAPVTPAADIYALGVLLYQMYTGQLPFRGESPDAHGTTSAIRIAYEHLHLAPEPPRQVNPRLSEAVEKVILRCLEKDPAQRYGSVSELYEALNDAIGTPSVSLDSEELAGEPVARRVDRLAQVVEPEAERVPTGVGGASRIVPEDDIEQAEVPDVAKPKRKAKREVREYEPRRGEKQDEKDRDSQEKQDEKQRDSDEKEQEKGTEKTDEKSEFWGDIGPSDRLSQLTWGGAAVWAGIVLLLNNIAATSGVFSKPFPWILTGAGALLLVEVAVRLVVPEYRARPGARLVLGIVLLMLGLGVGFSLGSLWPLILIAIGAGILFDRLTG